MSNIKVLILFFLLIPIFSIGQYYDDEEQPKEDFTLFKFLKKVWSNVNKAVGDSHKFELNVDSQTQDIVRVIDMQVDSKEIDLSKIHQFSVYNRKSLIRDF